MQPLPLLLLLPLLLFCITLVPSTSTASSSISSTSSSSYDPQALFDFALSNGADAMVTPGHFVRESDEGVHFPIRGVAAKEKIKVGDVVLSVPLNITMSSYTVENDPVLRDSIGLSLFSTLSDEENQLYFSQHETLLFELLYHRSLGESGPLWPYIESVLEADFSHYPLMMKEEQLEAKYPREQFAEVHINLEHEEWILKMLSSIVVPKLIDLNATAWGGDVLSPENLRWGQQMLHSRSTSDESVYLTDVCGDQYEDQYEENWEG